MKKAMNAGILGAIAGAGGPTKSIFNPGGIGASINDAIGGLVGPKYGSAGGLEGLSPRGGPEGGGGPLSIGSIIGPSGRASINRDVALAPGKKDEVKVEGGGIVMEGGLDREVVGRVIRMHLNQARYCYEKELSKSPGLSGKVTVQFVIGIEGRVDSAHVAETMMNNAGVEECLVRKIRSWEFPRPRGGGLVIVTYPFLFNSAGGP
jgi:TonB family protein